MTRLFFALVLIIIVLAQASALPAIVGGGIEPNLLLVCLLVWAGFRGPEEGLIWAFGAGLVMDLVALNPLGTTCLALIPVVLIGGLARRRLFHSGIIIPLVAVVGASLAFQVVIGVLGYFDGSAYPALVVIKLGMLTALLNMLVVPPLYLLLILLERLGVSGEAQA